MKETLAHYVGKQALIPWTPRPGGFLRVTIVDVREVFGRIDLKVEPFGGTGSSWVFADNVEIVPSIEITHTAAQS